MQKIVRQAALGSEALPPALEPCFDLLERVGEGTPFALFGGALRDARYWSMHNLPPGKINDYDIRMVLPEEHIEELTQRLGVITRKVVRVEGSAGTGLPLYRITDYYGADLDISFRSSLPVLGAGVAVQAAHTVEFSGSTRIAQERAANAVIGISGIAMDSNGTVWETPEHEADCRQKTLSVYPRTMFPYPSEPRVTEYLKHLQTKFPEHQVVFIPEDTRL